MVWESNVEVWRTPVDIQSITYMRAIIQVFQPSNVIFMPFVKNNSIQYIGLQFFFCYLDSYKFEIDIKICSKFVIKVTW